MKMIILTMPRISTTLLKFFITMMAIIITIEIILFHFHFLNIDGDVDNVIYIHNDNGGDKNNNTERKM